MAAQKISSVRAAATLVYGASNRFDFKDAKEFLLENMKDAVKEGQPPCKVYKEALKGLLLEDQIERQNIMSNYALVCMEDIKPLEELIRENEKLLKSALTKDKTTFAQRIMWFCFGITFGSLLLQLLMSLGILI